MTAIHIDTVAAANTERWFTWHNLRIPIAALLAIAAAAKFQDFTKILAGDGLLSSQPILLTAIGIEAALAFYLLFGDQLWSWRFVFALFSLFAIVSGALEVSLPSERAGESIKVVRLGPGAISGELGFLQDMERTATVRASGDTVVVSLSRASLESLLESDPLLIYRVMRAILRSVHKVVSSMNEQNAHLVDYIMG